jgi:mannose-6-phosphate isomerase-like protein (cupin superfamily)
MSRANGRLDLRNHAGSATEHWPSNAVMMNRFETKRLPDAADAIAPDGSEVRLLLQRPAGSMAHFELQPGRTSRAVTHRTVEEIWFFLSGEGEMWRKQRGGPEDIVRVEPGICVTIPLGTHFQFRCVGHVPLAAVAITMPPWPGDREADFVTGKWSAI